VKKTNAQWEGMNNGQRRRWLQHLWPHEVREQAEDRARATGRSISEVLASWAANAYISREKRREAEEGGGK
jgi:hypothetical protein